MDAGIPKLLESHFGPESDLINISQFVQRVGEEQNATGEALERQWTALSEERRTGLANECSVQDIKSALQQTWNNPSLSSFLLKEHERMTLMLNPGQSKSGRSIRRAHYPPPDTLPPEVRVLHGNLNDIKLSSWTLPLNTGAFIRTSRSSDQNAYDILKLDESDQGASVREKDEGIIIMTHAFLSSQTLQDLCKAIPCTPHATKIACSRNSSFQNYGIENDHASGCVICIEGLVYGDSGDDGYVQKLVDHLEVTSKSAVSVQKAPKSLSETVLSSLCIRINEPYWMLHRGNCEHFIVIEQIRAFHLSDPRSGYPLTLHQTPQILDICRACGKSPAVWSIVNDIRLGESPSFLCAPCWENMGFPDHSEGNPIEVIPLLAYVPT